MELKFDLLKENEIECRVGTCKENGLSLLLYKTARTDMAALDRAVGAMNWKRTYREINGNLFCTIAIRNEETGEWIEKEDVGTESFSEPIKGAVSDAAKRAATAWGIGRELYTAPFIWISSDKCNIKQRNGKYQCNDDFIVEKIAYTANGEIRGLSIKNEKTGKRVFTWVNPNAQDELQVHEVQNAQKEQKTA